jgi:hypothetical protein
MEKPWFSGSKLDCRFSTPRFTPCEGRRVGAQALEDGARLGQDQIMRFGRYQVPKYLRTLSIIVSEASVQVYLGVLLLTTDH